MRLVSTPVSDEGESTCVLPHLVSGTCRRDDRGVLMAVECDALPFPPVRVFTVIPSAPGTLRGGHGHLRCSQVLFCVQGQVDVTVRGGWGEVHHRLRPDGEGLLVPPLTWCSQKYVLESSCLLVFASHPYDADDYISDEALLTTLRSGSADLTSVVKPRDYPSATSPA